MPAEAECDDRHQRPLVGGAPPANVYAPGDYWLIPARVPGVLLWPRDGTGKPLAQPPHGGVHPYAPLASVTCGGGALSAPGSLRRTFTRVTP